MIFVYFQRWPYQVALPLVLIRADLPSSMAKADLSLARRQCEGASPAVYHCEAIPPSAVGS